MERGQGFSIAGRLRSLRFAWSGLLTLFRTEHNMRIHLAAAFAAVFMGFLFALSRMEWIVVAGCIAGVFAAEALNTAVEKLCDALHPDPDPRIGRVKDLCAAAVLVTATGALVAGILVFAPHMGAIFR
ncbi:diacylglycerol kinase [Pedobacter yulinensis]|uniref:Diacylglycerol kinase n=1 Tax=Pedobacter yulinensis TaxID=2126353 RepID=A0A2T3HJ71_9SPHI|nr:diacylglycerol kinase family protein [Pedobacter yulinensis]PST82484.1 diacylglycerol kinase [Pedobacter yulinensis]